jgi:hypothetical protein
VQKALARFTFVRDFIPELPVEIRLTITSFLDVSDLMVVRRVSKRWYRCWTHDSICNKLMKQYFRGTFNRIYMHLSIQERRSMFLNAIDRLHTMRTGRYHSMTILNYNLEDITPDIQRPVMDRGYCNGRVAWGTGCGVKVTNLRDGVTKTYMTPDRDQVFFWTLSENFLIGGTADKYVPHNDKPSSSV